MLNSITIMGRLTANPELARTSSGVAYTKFCVAVDRDYNGTGEKKVDFINCIAWRATAEFIGKYFEKGMPIVVTGRLEINPWKDRDGNSRRDAVINVGSAYFAGGKKKEASPASVSAADFDELGDDGDLPWGDDEELPL